MDLVNEIHRIGVKKGDTLNLKVSMKSTNVTANELIAALLEAVGPEGTIMAESFIRAYPLRYLRTHKKTSSRFTPSYAGWFANAMIHYPGSVRSSHPIQRFTAIGKRANELMNAHTADSYAYGPLQMLCLTGGKNLNIGKVVGVGTTHVAIGILGLKQVIPRVGIYQDGELFKRDWAGGCAVGFGNFKHEYLGCDKIAGANCTLSDMHTTLTNELWILSEDPSYFMCGKCIDCRYSWEFSPGWKPLNRVMLSLFRTYNYLKWSLTN